MNKLTLLIIIACICIGIVMINFINQRAPIERLEQTDSQPIEPKDIFESAKSGDLQSLKEFLEQGIDIDGRDDKGATALIEASYSGHLNVVHFLITQGASINVTTNNGWSALLAAQNRDIFRLLIKHNADTSAIAKNGFDVLMAAAHVGDLSALADFVKRGKDAKRKDSLGWSTLNYAIKAQHFDVVQYLVETGSNVNSRTNDGWTPLMSASEGENLSIVKYLVEHGSQINALNQNGWSPLMIASHYGNIDIVNYLIDNNADLKMSKHKSGWNALNIAAYNDHLPLVQLYISKGLPINYLDEDGENLLHIAASNDSLEVAKYLIENGVDVYGKRKWNQYTPLHIAAINGSIKTVKYLMDEFQEPDAAVKLDLVNLASSSGHLNVIEYLHAKGADLNGQVFNTNPDFSNSPLMLAARYGHIDIVRYLLDNGVNVNLQDIDGDTALMYASNIPLTPIMLKNDNIDIVTSLVDAGADINIKNVRGDTALSVLLRSDNIDAFRYLVSKGADVNTVNNDDNSILSNAVWRGKEEYVDLLLENNVKVTKGDIEVAFIHNHIDIAKKLLVSTELQKDELSSLLFSALEVRKSSLEGIQLLVESGANLEALDDYYDATPLMRAIYHRRLDIVQYLIEQGSQISTVNSKGQSALMKAANYGNLEIVKYLLERGSKLDTVDSTGETALMKAAQSTTCDNIKVIQYLVEAGADPAMKNDSKETVLSHALSYRCIKTFDYLLDVIKKKNILDKIDKEPLYKYIDRYGNIWDLSEFKASLDQYFTYHEM